MKLLEQKIPSGTAQSAGTVPGTSSTGIMALSSPYPLALGNFFSYPKTWIPKKGPKKLSEINSLNRVLSEAGSHPGSQGKLVLDLGPRLSLLHPGICPHVKGTKCKEILSEARDSEHRTKPSGKAVAPAQIPSTSAHLLSSLRDSLLSGKRAGPRWTGQRLVSLRLGDIQK